MATTKKQKIDPKQVKQFPPDAEMKAVAARKDLAIDEEITYQTVYKAVPKASLGAGAATKTFSQRALSSFRRSRFNLDLDLLASKTRMQGLQSNLSRRFLRTNPHGAAAADQRKDSITYQLSGAFEF